MNFTTAIKAEYIYRPTQLLKRLFNNKKNFNKNCILPWDYKLNVKEDNIGKAINQLGLYDLVVSEVLSRISGLASSGDLLVDAGANIGHMSSILDCYGAKDSFVHAFEPHPEVFLQLKSNSELWPSKKRLYLHQLALSENEGWCDFHLPAGFDKNQGLGFISTSANEHLLKSSTVLTKVEMTTLDKMFQDKNIFLMKIDTEGSELAVLKGAKGLIENQKLRNIVFEDHQLYPTPIMTYLESKGFTLFSIQRSLSGPVIKKASESKAETWEPNSFLATLEPNFILEIFSKTGWNVLR
jgi:FkbM family methyltransferase